MKKYLMAPLTYSDLHHQEVGSPCTRTYGEPDLTRTFEVDEKRMKILTSSSQEGWVCVGTVKEDEHK